MLREAFDYPYRQIADILGLSEANARQLLVRARAPTLQPRRLPVGRREQRRLVGALSAASRSGEVAPLEQLLAVAASPGSVRGMGIPEWVEPMLATLSDERDLSDDWVLERKLDGVRCLAFVRGGAVALRSRNRLPLAFPGIAGALEPLGDAIVDGEIVAVADDGEPLGFQALQRHGTAALWAFDLLWLDGEDLRDRPQRERHAALAPLSGPAPRSRSARPSPGRAARRMSVRARRAGRA